LQFNDDILSIEYEYFSYEFDATVGLDVNLRAKYESFSFDPIQTNFFFESHKSKFVESKAIIIEHFDLDQAHMYVELKRLVDLGSIMLPRLLISDDTISRPTTYVLAAVKYVPLFPDWA